MKIMYNITFLAHVATVFKTNDELRLIYYENSRNSIETRAIRCKRVLNSFINQSPLELTNNYL